MAGRCRRIASASHGAIEMSGRSPTPNYEARIKVWEVPAATPAAAGRHNPREGDWSAPGPTPALRNPLPPPLPVGESPAPGIRCWDRPARSPRCAPRDAGRSAVPGRTVRVAPADEPPAWPTLVDEREADRSAAAEPCSGRRDDCPAEASADPARRCRWAAGWSLGSARQGRRRFAAESTRPSPAIPREQFPAAAQSTTDEWAGLAARD